MEHCRFKLDAAGVYGISSLGRGSRPVAGRARDGTSILFEADAAISYNIKFI